MRNLFKSIGRTICVLIDYFYPPFKKHVTIQFFRYGVSGVANMVFDWVLFALVYNFVLKHQMVHVGLLTFSSYIAALFITFPITFLSGFLLQKYVTFTASDLRGRVQLVRYTAVVGANLMLNYLGLKMLVEFVGFFPTPSKMIVTIFTTLFSYISQKRYTFKLS